MYKNWTRKTGKKYILGFAGLFAFGALLFSVLLLVLRYKGFEPAQMGVPKILLLSSLLALAPAGSFSGFVVMFNGVDELGERNRRLIVFFCVPLTIFAIPFGIIMFIPSVIATVRLPIS